VSGYDILEDDFCLYCQREFRTPQGLQIHVARVHPGTYADHSIKEAKAKRKARVLAVEMSQGMGEVDW